MHSKIKKTPAIILSASLALLSGLKSQDGGNSFRIEEPVKVTNQDNQTFLLVGMQGESVIFQFEGMQDSEASILIRPESDIKLSYPYPEDFGDIQFNVLNGNYRAALQDVSDSTRRLLHFLSIPEDKCNFHLIAEIYYRALAYVGPYPGKPEEVVEASGAIPWGSPNLPPQFLQHASTILDRMVSEERIETSKKLLTIFQNGLSVEQFSQLALPVANKLRVLGENEMVENIYAVLGKSSDPETKKLGTLWSAYNFANTGRVEVAKKLLDEIGEMTEEDPLFGIYCLAQGRLALTEKNSIQALRFLSRAMVRSTIADSYKPEIYFLMIQSYMMDENETPAKRLAKEMAVFYPNNMWHKSVVERFPEINAPIEVEGQPNL